MTRNEFTEHVKGTQKALRRFLAALCCGDTQHADDLAQEAYLKAWLACDTLKDSQKFDRWVFRIAYNCYISSRRGTSVTVDVDNARHLEADDSTDDSFRYQELHGALNRLKENERTAILLFYLEGYDSKEIAEVMGASHDAVRQYLSRGRTHLRELLSK